jgi:hypothetical protein
MTSIASSTSSGQSSKDRDGIRCSAGDRLAELDGVRDGVPGVSNESGECHRGIRPDAGVRPHGFQEVKQDALDLLGDSRRFRSVPGPGAPNPSIETLGLVLREFFERFDSVEEINGEFAVSRQAVRPSTIRPGFVRIGSDFAHSELVTKPGDDRVFIVTDTEHALDGLPTIYHNIYLLE